MSNTSLPDSRQSSPLLQAVLIGFVVAIVNLNLGASLGELAGRGVVAGMLSAGVIMLITAMFGGTRVQCSGPTAPMVGMFALVMAAATDTVARQHPDIPPHHFVNMVLLLMAPLLLLFGALRLGNLIKLVPPVVVSSFMSGIAMLIWLSQYRTLHNISPTEDVLWLNGVLVLATVTLMLGIKPFLTFIHERLALLPASLVAMLLVSGVCAVWLPPVAYVQVEALQLADVPAHMAAQLPTWAVLGNMQVLAMAFMYALALALLCSIDTLVTAKIMDKMTDGDNNHNRDLGANGVAAAAVALTGGVPGAMSTVPSVMMVKEGATSRLPGVMVGLFCLLGVFAFAPLFGYVPKAVFIGVLIVVGWQVLDTKPVLNLLRAHRENMRSRKLAWYDILLMKVVLAIILLVDMGTFIGIAVGTALHHTGNWLLKRKKRRAEALNNA